jgi:hypothetical protein
LERRNACGVLAGKPGRKGLLHGWENKIKMNNKEVGLKGVDWINLAKDRGK